MMALQATRINQHSWRGCLVSPPSAYLPYPLLFAGKFDISTVYCYFHESKLCFLNESLFS